MIEPPTAAGDRGTPLDRRAFLGLTGISMAAFTLGIAAPADRRRRVGRVGAGRSVPARGRLRGPRADQCGAVDPARAAAPGRGRSRRDARLVVGSVGSDGDGTPTDTYTELWLSNPHVKFYDGRRGYVRATMTPEALTSDYRVVDYIRRDDQAPVSTAATFVTEAGKPGLTKVVR